MSDRAERFEKNNFEIVDAGHSGAEKSCGGPAGASAGELSIARDRDMAQFPDGVRLSVAHKCGEYDARRLRSQREVIRDVMLSAAECDTWLTLGELRALTRYGEASISAQLRHLRKTENGGYELVKRHREGMCGGRASADARGERTWEYRLGRGVDGDAASGRVARLDAVA